MFDVVASVVRSIVDWVVEAVCDNPVKSAVVATATVVTGGVALSWASFIGALVSAAGFGVGGGTLSGAAASSAGLAALGGGSLASGGFGVAGGKIVVTSAGALLGGGGASVVDVE